MLLPSLVKSRSQFLGPLCLWQCFIDSLFILATALISFKMSLLTAGAWLTQRLWGYWRESESLNFKLYFSELTLSLLTGASAWLCMVYLSTFQIVFVQISNSICPNFKLYLSKLTLSLLTGASAWLTLRPWGYWRESGEVKPPVPRLTSVEAKSRSRLTSVEVKKSHGSYTFPFSIRTYLIYICQ